MNENEIKTMKELKEIWRGLMYHCGQLSKFMAEHGGDEFFKTDLGMKMSSKALSITMAHMTGMILLDELKDVGINKKDFTEFEDLLKEALNNN